MRVWVGVCLVAAITLAACGRNPRPLAAEPAAITLPADGFSRARIVFAAAGAAVSVVDGRHRARIESVFTSGASTEAVLRAGVLPGEATVEATAAGFAPARVRVSVTPDLTDADRDGLPDALALTDEADRAAFVDWFATIAEAQYADSELPAEINDCAALLRFAYREALRQHDSAQAAALRMPVLPASAGVQKYQYPYTPLGANLFRTPAGFAEFADAETLMRLNTGLITRDVRNAAPGDLLFYRQLDQNMPFHAMVYVGPSRLQPGGAPVVVYHTGPIGKHPGEIRRVTISELLRHPSPRWRPVAGNSNFLGFFRWNILNSPGLTGWISSPAPAWRNVLEESS